MNFDIAIETLRERLKMVGAFTPRKSPMPVLDNVKMEIVHSSLKVSCTNLDVYISTTVPVIHDEDFALTVNVQDLSSFVASLTGNAAISFDGHRMTLKCGTAKAAFPTIDAKEFPQVPTHGGKEFTIASAALQKAMDLVEFAASSDELGRPVLTCFNVIAKDNLLTVACTDGFRVAETQTPIVFDGDKSVLISKSHLSAIKKLSGDIRVELGTNVTSFISDDTVIYSINMSGTFPLYRAIVPKAFKNVVTITSVAWMKAILRRCLSFEPQVVSMLIEQDSILFSVETEQKGKYDEQLPIVTTKAENATPKQVSLNPNMLVELVTTSESLGKELLMSWNESHTPVMYTVSGIDTWLSIIMPMKLIESGG